MTLHSGGVYCCQIGKSASQLIEIHKASKILAANSNNNPPSVGSTKIKIAPNKVSGTITKLTQGIAIALATKLVKDT